MQPVAEGYQLIVVQADGTVTVEQYDNPDRLHRRQLALQKRFVDAGWCGPHGRNI